MNSGVVGECRASGEERAPSAPPGRPAAAKRAQGNFKFGEQAV